MDQQTSGIPKSVAHEGCKYLCHLKIAELLTGKSMSVEMLNSDYADHVKYGWLGKNSKSGYTANIIKPNEIMADFCQDLGMTAPFPRQIGRNPGDGVYTFWGGKQTKPVKYHLVEFKTTNGYHWVLFDHMMNEIYDPWTKPYTRVEINSINLIG